MNKEREAFEAEVIAEFEEKILAIKTAIEMESHVDGNQDKPDKEWYERQDKNIAKYELILRALRALKEEPNHG